VLVFSAGKPPLTVAFESAEELEEWADAFEKAADHMTTPPAAEVNGNGRLMAFARHPPL
jgi:hypothetical protein